MLAAGRLLNELLSGTPYLCHTIAGRIRVGLGATAFRELQVTCYQLPGTWNLKRGYLDHKEDTIYCYKATSGYQRGQLRVL